MVRQHLKPALLSSFIFFLSACGTILPPPATETSGETDTQVPENERLVETLVRQAGKLGSMDIVGVGGILNTRELEEDETVEEVLPVTPTIPMTANRIVERAVNDLLQNRQSLLKLWIERGDIYFPMVEQIFAEEGVPDELKYLALGESSLNPSARSYASAVGMWQFMAATGRSSGLEITPWVDERMDPEKSTRAAARHFLELYESYNQNWHLALAGYNCSYRCISRAVRRAGGTIEDPPSYWEIYSYLPRETREFVPKFMAAAMIVSNPELYGIEYEKVPSTLAYDVVQISGMLTLEDAAGLAGTNMATLKDLNPSLRRNTLPDSSEPFSLKIPPGSFERFVTAFEQLPAKDRVSPSEYVIRSGDTLGRIAARFEVSVADLQAFNGIRGTLIHPDQKLLIPGTGTNNEITLADTEPQSVRYGTSNFRPIQVLDQFQLVEQEVAGNDATVMTVVLTQDQAEDIDVPLIYQVNPGDSLGVIAEQFDVSVQELQQWNSLRGTLIRAGQNLTIHSASSTARITSYRVQRGDNLAAIARRFGVTVENLKSWNGLDSDLIFPGQNLQLN